MEIVNISTDFGQHHLQLIIMLFPLKHLELKIPDKLGQGYSSVSAVSHIAILMKHLVLGMLSLDRKLLYFGWVSKLNFFLNLTYE